MEMIKERMEPGTTWFTSDNHFGHARIIELSYRPFSTVEDMDAAMAENWNAVVKPTDTVIHVGDVALGKRQDTLQIIKELNGRKLLIPGNHDKVWPGHKKVAQRDIDLYESVGFEILPMIVLLDLGGTVVKVSHLPYTGDSHGEERFAAHRPVRAAGSKLPLISGHVHSEWAVQDEQINVGVDVRDFAPISGQDILKLIYR